MKAVGYRQVLHYLNGDYDKKIMREKDKISNCFDKIKREYRPSCA
jgi:hypothetical protein